MVPVILVEATVGFDAKVRIGVVLSVKNPVILVFPYADPILFKYSRGPAPYSLVFQIQEEMMSPCHGRFYASCLGARQMAKRLSPSMFYVNASILLATELQRNFL